MKLTLAIVMGFFLYMSISRAQETKVKPKVIYKYKQYESFDLGNLEIKGSLIAPGDLSVKERQRKLFSRNLFDREEFNPEVREDIRNLR